MNISAFKELIHSHHLPLVDFLQWSDDQRNIAAMFYMRVQTRRKQHLLKLKAARYVSACPYAQGELFLQEYRHNLFMLVEPELRKLVELLK